MRYYKDAEGNIKAYYKEGFTEVLSPVRADGTILPNHKNIDLLALQEDGTRYPYYLEESVDGVYQPDTERIEEYQDEQDELALKEEQSALKLVGVEFDGIMCSATAEDMWGLTSVATGLASFDTEYNFKFDNGNVLVINRDNYTEFMAVWTPFRASFF